MEQEGLTKFKKELLTVRLDNETSAGGTADARWPDPPTSLTRCHLGTAGLDAKQREGTLRCWQCQFHFLILNFALILN